MDRNWNSDRNSLFWILQCQHFLLLSSLALLLSRSFLIGPKFSVRSVFEFRSVFGPDILPQNLSLSLKLQVYRSSYVKLSENRFLRFSNPIFCLFLRRFVVAPFRPDFWLQNLKRNFCSIFPVDNVPNLPKNIITNILRARVSRKMRAYAAAYDTLYNFWR